MFLMNAISDSCCLENVEAVLGVTIRVSQGKQAHLHKYAVKNTLAAPGCGCGDGVESEVPHPAPPAPH